MSNNNSYGQLHLILGCMYSGKTTELKNRYDRYSIGGRKCIMVKYKGDIRYEDEYIVTHSGIKERATVCKYLYLIDKLVQNYDVICIDEIQFYKDAYIFCDKWSSFDGKIVQVCGLNGNFKRKPFEIISKLIPLADSICYKTAICRETGNDGIYSQRLTDEQEEEVIGGEEMYIASDKTTYFKEKNKIADTHEELLNEFAKVYAEINNKNCQNINKIKLKDMIKSEKVIFYEDMINN